MRTARRRAGRAEAAHPTRPRALGTPRIAFARVAVNAIAFTRVAVNADAFEAQRLKAAQATAAPGKVTLAVQPPEPAAAGAAKGGCC